MKGKELEIKRGYIYRCDLGKGVGSEQGGIRPVLVLKNQKGIDFSPVITVVPITSKINKGKNIPTHITIGKESGLLVPSDLQLEQITTVSKDRFLFNNTNKNKYEIIKMGEVSDYILEKVEIAWSKDNGYKELYFNERKAYNYLDMLSEIKNAIKTTMNNMGLELVKEHLVKEFKYYCSCYNKDYKVVYNNYKANKNMMFNDEMVVVSYNHKCS